jgi:zinc protease
VSQKTSQTESKIPTAAIGPHTIQRACLSNGIGLVVQENHNSPSLVIRGYLWTGSIDDPLSKLGLARFTSLAMSRGTSTRSFEEINETIESIGAAFHFSGGRQLLGLGGKALAEDFELLVDVLADVLRYPSFPETEIEKIRGQIITGLKELEDDTAGLASRDFRELLYTPENAYGRPSSGRLDTVPEISREDILAFYDHYVSPSGACLVVVGDVDAARAVDVLENKLWDWNPPHAVRGSGLPEVPTLTEQRRKLRPMDNKTQVDIVLGTQGPPRSAPDFYAARLANVVLGQLGLMGRLGKSVRDEQGLAYYSRSSLEGGLGPGAWNVRAGVAPDSVDRAVQAILVELGRLQDEPVDEQELVDSQDYSTGTLPLRLETNDGIAATLSDMQIHNLGDDYIMRYPDLIRSVTSADIQAAARKYLDVEKYALAIAGPYHGEKG